MDRKRKKGCKGNRREVRDGKGTGIQKGMERYGKE